MSKRISRISLATVYNLLNKLHQENVIGVLEFDEMENRYDGDTSHHWNLVCLGCRKIVDYKPVHTIDQEQVKRATHFEMVRSRLDLYGYCHECARKKERQSLKGGSR